MLSNRSRKQNHRTWPDHLIACYFVDAVVMLPSSLQTFPTMLRQTQFWENEQRQSYINPFIYLLGPSILFSPLALQWNCTYLKIHRNKYVINTKISKCKISDVSAIMFSLRPCCVAVKDAACQNFNTGSPGTCVQDYSRGDEEAHLLDIRIRNIFELIIK